MEQKIADPVGTRDVHSGNGTLLPAVIASAPIVVFALDNEGVFTLSKGKGLEALGLKEGQVVGQSVFDVYHDQPKVLEDVRRALSGESFSANVTVGNLVFETRFTPLLDQDGTAAGVIGVSIDISEKIQTRNALRQRANELSTLLDVSRAISVTLDLDEVLELIAEHLTKSLGASGCTISRWDREADVIITWIDWREDPNDSSVPPGELYKLKEIPATRGVLENCQPVSIRVSDPAADPAEVALLREFGSASLLMLPLSGGEQVIGLVEMEDKKDREFSHEEIQFCQGLVDQATIAIRNARLYQETQRSLLEQTALREAGAILSSTLDIDTLLSHLAEQMGRAIDATSAYISSFDVEANTSLVMAEYFSPEATDLERESDLHEEYDHTIELQEILDLILAGKADGYHVDDPDLDEETRSYMEEYGCKSIIEIPLKIRGRINAYAELWETRYRREFTPGEIALCKAIAQQAAVALENARLYEQAQEELKRRRQVEDQLRHDAFHDALTNLPNRALFTDRLERAILRNKRNAEDMFAVLFLDLDSFKVVNDSLGHNIGDILLVEVANRLGRTIRDVDTVARLGGDEFVVLIEGVSDNKDLRYIAERINQELMAPFSLNGYEVITTASIGIVRCSVSYNLPEEYLRDADLAMYHAKSQGKARYEVFSSSLRQKAMTRLTMESDLRKAIERQEFILHYQPITSFEAGNIVGFEALMRWQHPKLGLVPPARFIPLAEETGLIIPMGYWVIREACARVKYWQKLHPSNPPLSVSVNLSGGQLMQPEFCDKVAEILVITGLQGESLSFEVTESVVISDAEFASEILHQLRDLGISVHMDDFGTGYSSLSYLRNFPMDVIKIDRTFIQKMDAMSNNSGLVKSIIFMAQELGLKVVGEGIETNDQMEMLAALGCDYGQGYLISKPLDSEKVESLLSERSGN